MDTPHPPQNADSNKHIVEAFGVQILTSQHPKIRQLKRNTPKTVIHGNKFWGSSCILMKHLQHHQPKKNCKVLEIGCGWGLAGIHCAKHYQAHVTGLDADEAVFPFLEQHAEQNNVVITSLHQQFEDIGSQQLSDYDLMIGSDICFWDELADPVYHLIKRAVETGVSSIMIADPGRPPFFELAQRCIDDFYAELEDYKIEMPLQTKGCVLFIENA